MYPSLIAKRLRFGALSSALDEGGASYLALSAVVGLQSLDAGTLSASQRAHIVSALTSLITTGCETLAARAAAAIGRYLRADEAPALVGSLDRPEPLVRQNVLAALIEVLGPETVFEFMAEVGPLTDDGREFVARQLCADHGFNPDGTVDPAKLLLSGVGTPLLAHLPNLEDGEVDEQS